MACSVRWHLTRGSESKPSWLKKGRAIWQKKESMQRSWGTLGLGIVQAKQEDWGSWRKWSTSANWEADSEDVMIAQEVYLRTMLRINMYTRKWEEAGLNKGKVGPWRGLDRGLRQALRALYLEWSFRAARLYVIYPPVICKPLKKGHSLARNSFLHQWAISMGAWRLQEIILSVLKRRHIKASTTPKERMLSHNDKNTPGTRLLQSHK